MEKGILDKIIGEGYDSRIRPMGNASVGARGGGMYNFQYYSCVFHMFECSTCVCGATISPLFAKKN